MILCCGEALIDMVPDTTGAGDTCMVPKSGGAVFNTAIALGRLGHDVGLFTGVSDDLFGRQLTKELSASHVNCQHLVHLAAPSSLAFVELTGGQASYTFYTENAADTVLEARHCPDQISKFDAMFFGGISLCTDPTATTMSTLMQRASQSGVVTMIDPNIRRSFIRDEGVYRDRLMAMMGTADIIKVSDEDLAWISKSDGQTEQQVQSLALPNTPLFLITKGADGAQILRDRDSFEVKQDGVVDVVDTIGAGDTFNAGFLAALVTQGVLNKENLATIGRDILENAAQYANKCAAITVSRKGADVPWASDL